MEVGVFSTRMTPISRMLKTKGVEESLHEVSDHLLQGSGLMHEELLHVLGAIDALVAGAGAGAGCSAGLKGSPRR